MVCCICSCSGGVVVLGFFASCVVCAGSCVESAVLMIFTSPVSAVLCVASGGAIGGFVITGLGAAGAARLERFFRRVWAWPSTTQKLTTRHAAMRYLTQLRIHTG